MKHLFIFLAFLPFYLFGKGLVFDKVEKKDSIFTSADAEKILGQKAILKESFDETKNGKTQLKFTFSATKNPNSNLYFMFQVYEDEILAKKAFDELVSQSIFKKLENVGEEAFLATDKQNFCLIMTRKGKFEIRIKVNKITSGTSLSELKIIAKKIIEAI